MRGRTLYRQILLTMSSPCAVRQAASHERKADRPPPPDPSCG